MSAQLLALNALSKRALTLAQDRIPLGNNLDILNSTSFAFGQNTEELVNSAGNLAKENGSN